MASEHYEKYGRASYEKHKEKQLAKSKENYHSGGGKAVKANQYRAARRDTILRNRYGITASDYDALFDQQGGKCAICCADYNTANRNMDVDHDHETGKIRGLLCNNCNRGLGHFQDDPNLLEAAKIYLNISGKGGSCGV